MNELDKIGLHMIDNRGTFIGKFLVLYPLWPSQPSLPLTHTATIEIH